MKDVLNVKCTCTVCGFVGKVCIPAPVELDSIYENAWKRFSMRKWNRLPKTDFKSYPPKSTQEYVYYCPECGGR